MDEKRRAAKRELIENHLFDRTLEVLNKGKTEIPEWESRIKIADQQWSWVVPIIRQTYAESQFVQIPMLEGRMLSKIYGISQAIAHFETPKSGFPENAFDLLLWKIKYLFDEIHPHVDEKEMVIEASEALLKKEKDDAIYAALAGDIEDWDGV